MALPAPFFELGVAEPYPGLRSFHVHEWPIFFGRKPQTDQLHRMLVGNRFVAVLGASGCGKSSLVKAGLVARITEEAGSEQGKWLVAIMRPQDRPMANLANALAKPEVLGRLRPNESDVRSALEGTLQQGPAGLVEALVQSRMPAGKRLLLVVDQFEELFTFGPQPDDEAEGARTHPGRSSELEQLQRERCSFVQLLLESTKSSDDPRRPRVHVVVTMRSEFLGDCVRFEGLPERLNEGQFLTPRLTREERHLAIEGPAEFFGKQLSPTLVNRLLNDSSVEGDPLPLLQHSLMRMWSMAAGREDAVISSVDVVDPQPEGNPQSDPFADQPPALNSRPGPATAPFVAGEGEDAYYINLHHYALSGQLAFALDRHAESVYRALDAGQRRIARVLFRRLTGGRRGQADTRHTATIEDVAKIAGVERSAVEAVVCKFGREGPGFVVWNDDDLGAATVLDIAHESLIRRWSSLSRWAEQEAGMASQYRTLVAFATDSDALLPERTLRWVRPWEGREAEFREWASRHGTTDAGGDVRSDFDAVDDLLNRSRRALGQQQLKSRIQTFSLRLALLVVGLLFLASLYLYARGKVDKKNADLATATYELAQQRLKASQKELDAQEALTAEQRHARLNLDLAYRTSEKQKASVLRLNKALQAKQKLLQQATNARIEAIRSIPAKTADLLTGVADNYLKQGSLGALTAMEMSIKAIEIARAGRIKVSDSLTRALRQSVIATAGFQLATDRKAPLANSASDDNQMLVSDDGSAAVWQGVDHAFYVWRRSGGVQRIGLPSIQYQKASIARDGTHVLLVRSPVASDGAVSQKRALQSQSQAQSAAESQYEWWAITPVPRLVCKDRLADSNSVAISNKPGMVRIMGPTGFQYVGVASGTPVRYPFVSASIKEGGERESSDGRFLVVALSNEKASLYDVAVPRNPKAVLELNCAAEMTAFTEASDRLAAYDQGTQTCLEYELSKRALPTNKWPLKDVSGVGFNPGGLLLACTESNSNNGGALYSLDRHRRDPLLLADHGVDGVLPSGLVVRIVNLSKPTVVDISQFSSAGRAPSKWRITIAGDTPGMSSNYRFALSVDNGLPKIWDLSMRPIDYSRAPLQSLEERAERVLDGYAARAK
jgi:energy-coupling factor transporter ATP-binding protein EcfA2